MMAGTEVTEGRTTVGDVGRADLAGVQQHATVAEAAKLMRDLDVGSAAVFDRANLVGIVTERDVMFAALDGADLEQTPVTDYMTRQPATIWVDADISQAALAMCTLHARHLPVVDGANVVGMVSSRDLMEALYDHRMPGGRTKRTGGFGTLWRKRPRIADIWKL